MQAYSDRSITLILTEREAQYLKTSITRYLNYVSDINTYEKDTLNEISAHLYKFLTPPNKS